MASVGALVMDSDDSGGGTVSGSVVQRTLLPDIVLFSRAARIVVFLELTVPWKTRVGKVQEMKQAMYAEMIDEIGTRDFKCRFMRLRECAGIYGMVHVSVCGFAWPEWKGA